MNDAERARSGARELYYNSCYKQNISNEFGAINYALDDNSRRVLSPIRLLKIDPPAHTKDVNNDDLE